MVDTRVCRICTAEFGDCVKCQNGSEFMSDSEPVVCGGCGRYSSGVGLCTCGWDMSNEASTSVFESRRNVPA
jgi:hypothetical protein